nr:hypothetical protein CFP56_02608 [Quercus suber]
MAVVSNNNQEDNQLVLMTEQSAIAQINKLLEERIKLHAIEPLFKQPLRLLSGFVRMTDASASAMILSNLTSAERGMLTPRLSV